MYKRHKVWQELMVFFKRHIAICVLCVICVFIILKNSLLPMPAWFPSIVFHLFQAPSAGTASAELWALLDKLSLAFIGGVVVYIITEYLPERKKAYKSFIILKQEISCLYSYMSRIIDMYLFDSGLQKRKNGEPNGEQLKSKWFEITDDEKKCKCERMRNGEYTHELSYNYNLYQDSKSYCLLVEETINRLKGNISFSQLDPSILETISMIENNEYTKMFSEINHPRYSIPENRQFRFDLGGGFFEYIACHTALEKYDFDQTSFDYSLISDEEFLKHKEEGLFYHSKRVFSLRGASSTTSVADEIVALEPTEERLRNSACILLEMLAYYDSFPQKPGEVLDAAEKIAEYVCHNEVDSAKETIDYINYLQIKKRLNTLSKEDYDNLKQIISEGASTSVVLISSAILAEDYQKADEIFARLTEDEVETIVQLPVYNLWPDPPIPADNDTAPFRLYSKIYNIQ